MVPELAEIIRRHALQIAPAMRSRFYEPVDRAIAGSELGPGSVARACREVQKEFIAAPEPKAAIDGRR
jgi:hypothetical protein